MVAGDPEIEGDDLHPLECAFGEFTSPIAVLIVGELHADQQLGGGDSADRDIGIIREHIGLILVPALQCAQGTGVKDQSLHGSCIGALPTKRRTSARLQIAATARATARTVITTDATAFEGLPGVVHRLLS